MPSICRLNLPRSLYAYQLLERVQKRQFSGQQITLMIRWLDAEPEVPLGRWFKRFPGLTVCGEDALVTAFLPSGQSPSGQEIE